MGRALASASDSAPSRRSRRTQAALASRPVLPEAMESLLANLRNRLELAFQPDTAAQGFGTGRSSSTGHCAVVAAILQQMAAGDLVSATVEGQSHWFNRLSVGGRQFDVDLTGDQFGLPSIRVGVCDGLFPATRVRHPAEINPETLRRAISLAKRAALSQVASSLQRRLRANHERGNTDIGS